MDSGGTFLDQEGRVVLQRKVFREEGMASGWWERSPTSGDEPERGEQQRRRARCLWDLSLLPFM